MKIFKKLVRDRIPEIIAAAGDKAITRELGADERFHELLVKLGEESAEALGAEGDAAELAKEFADVLEVLDAAIFSSGIPRSEIDRVRADRRAMRGGFEKGIFLEGTE